MKNRHENPKKNRGKPPKTGKNPPKTGKKAEKPAKKTKKPPVSDKKAEKQGKNPRKPTGKTAYDSYIQRSREYRARVSSRGRDIGPIAAISDVKRHESCRFDFKEFCEAYNAPAFYLGWSQNHLDAIARISDGILNGALYAYAMPRGSGKSTLAKMAVLWAVSYGHRFYPFLIGATASKAQRMLDSIKIWMRFNRPYIDDFPHISQAAIELQGRGTGCTNQNCEGTPTLMTWTKNELVLPTVPCPPNMPAEYRSELAPTSGTIIGVSGLTGDEIRGSLKTTAGRELRPDFCLLDDPQTDASARSETQTAHRLELITGAVLGMAGPDKTISFVMPCTCIEENCVASQLTDRTKNPLFRGHRSSMISKLPDNLPLWDKYFSVYESCMLLEPPDITAANNFYLKHRSDLESGTVATWVDRKHDNEISAIQHAMHLYKRDAKTFFSEYQNQPVSTTTGKAYLTAREISEKTSGYKRFRVPLEVEKITAFIDVQQELLFYCVVGWSAQFSGFILDYGTYPQQTRQTFSKTNLSVKLSSKWPNISEKARIYQALGQLTGHMQNTRFERDNDGADMKIDRIGIDSRYQTTTVRRFLRDVKSPLLIPTMGGAYGINEKPMNHPDNIKKWTTGGRRLGVNWRQQSARDGVRTIEVNPNFWKTFIHELLLTSIAETGSLSLFTGAAGQHTLFAQHLTAERVETKTAKYGQVDIWKEKPGAGDNDFFDCVVGCAVIASVEGITAAGVEQITRKRKQSGGGSWDKFRGQLGGGNRGRTKR